MQMKCAVGCLLLFVASIPTRAQSVRVAPHLADGGGWTTTLLLSDLFHGSEYINQISFLSTTGAPLVLSFSIDGAPAVTAASANIRFKPSQTVIVRTLGSGAS